MARRQAPKPSYLTLSKSSDDGYKVTIYGPKETRRMRKASEPFETIPTPQGVDLIAALFLSPDCFNGPKVHDGEDDYEIKLLKRRARNVSAKPALLQWSRYPMRLSSKRQQRSETLHTDRPWEINGNTVAVAASIKIPLRCHDPSERAEKSTATAAVRWRILMAEVKPKSKLPSESAEKSTATSVKFPYSGRGACLGILREAQ